MRNIRNKKGSALNELLITIAILGTLAAASTPDLSSFKTWAHNIYTQAHLHNLYLACKTYWTNNSGTDSCSLTIVKQTTYGFVQSAHVTVVMEGDTELTFSARARHNSEDTEYTVCAHGDIQTIPCGA
ncbi:MAG: type II secretion system protein [Nitrospinaceae bacterium]